MKDATLPEVIVAIVLLIFAGSVLVKGATIPPPVPTATPGLEATEPPATEVPVVIASPAATQVAFVPVTGATTVQVSNVGSYGPALVDGQGRSLYLYIGGQYDSTKPCAGEECLEDWIPLLTGGKPVAGQGLDATRLGTIPRADGTIQVTYNGWPLYGLASDKAPGDATGQGDDNEWYLISPSGDPIKSQGHE